jgi:hypothetical protein
VVLQHQYKFDIRVHTLLSGARRRLYKSEAIQRCRLKAALFPAVFPAALLRNVAAKYGWHYLDIPNVMVVSSYQRTLANGWTICWREPRRTASSSASHPSAAWRPLTCQIPSKLSCVPQRSPWIQVTFCTERGAWFVAACSTSTVAPAAHIRCCEMSTVARFGAHQHR